MTTTTKRIVLACCGMSYGYQSWTWKLLPTQIVPFVALWCSMALTTRWIKTSKMPGIADFAAGGHASTKDRTRDITEAVIRIGEHVPLLLSYKGWSSKLSQEISCTCSQWEILILYILILINPIFDSKSPAMVSNWRWFIESWIYH